MKAMYAEIYTYTIRGYKRLLSSSSLLARVTAGGGVDDGPLGLNRAHPEGGFGETGKIFTSISRLWL